jgi:hypothetical protein
VRGGGEGVAELGQTFSGSHCAVPVGNWALSFLHTVHFARHHPCLLPLLSCSDFALAGIFVFVARFATGSCKKKNISLIYDRRRIKRRGSGVLERGVKARMGQWAD